jgi:integrase
MAAKLEKTRHPGIYKRGSRYVIVWEHRGRQHKESFSTLAEARKAKGRKQAGERRPVSRVGFEDYFLRWIKTYAGRTARGFSETTRPEYERPIRVHALGPWQGWKLAEIEPADVRQRLSEMNVKGCSVSQMKKLRAALSALFATAVDDNLLRSNPVQGVRIPATPDEEPQEEKAKALTRAELGVMLRAIPEEWQLFFEFLTHTGLRISEAIGLRWEHLDLGGNRTLRVREQFYRGKRRRLKSGAGKRDIPLSPGMAARLREHRAVGYRGPKTPVFASGVGTELIRCYRQQGRPAGNQDSANRHLSHVPPHLRLAAL